MQKAHDASKNDFWHNQPDTSSPITETELNRIETNIDTIDDRVVTFDISKANQSDLLTCVSGISLNTTTGILTITLKNGTTSTLDTGLAKLAINFDYDDDPSSAHYQQIILEMKDGTYKYIDLSALITQYEFVNTSTIVWTIESDGKIKANVPDGSITSEKLQPNYLADITTQANRATGAVTSTETNRLEAEGFAKGTQNGQPVGVDSPYYENNAKYFRDGARAITGNKVDTWNGRDGMVVPLDGDYNISQIAPGSGAVEGQVPVVNGNGKFELGSVTSTYYAVCNTEFGYVQKQVSINGFPLSYMDGQIIVIKFNYEAGAGATLKINNLSAKPIKYRRQGGLIVPIPNYVVTQNSFGTFMYAADLDCFLLLSVDRNCLPRWWYWLNVPKGVIAYSGGDSDFSASSPSIAIIKVYSESPKIKIKKIEKTDGIFTVYFKEPVTEATRIKIEINYPN